MHVSAIKTATQGAIKIIGGCYAAEDISRVRHSQLGEYQNRNSPQVVPVDVAIDLDLSAQEPLILAAMAHAEGFRLMPVSFSGSGHIPKDMAQYAKATSDVLQDALNALADGQVDVQEAHAILAHIQRARMVSGQIESALHKIIAENKPHIVASSNAGAA
ncbi:hypothetical protein [Acetobacter sp. KSO5]|uniref:hypothetical protein n=1 Tax=Acetobacter sp. KSO5 TaxID=3373674 RepID=UPI00376F3D11